MYVKKSTADSRMAAWSAAVETNGHRVARWILETMQLISRVQCSLWTIVLNECDSYNVYSTVWKRVNKVQQYAVRPQSFTL